jgi:hypothetical protein
MTGPFFILLFFRRGCRCQLGFLTGCMRLFANRCMTMFFGGVAVAGHGVPCPYTPTRGVAASSWSKLRLLLARREKCFDLPQMIDIVPGHHLH